MSRSDRVFEELLEMPDYGEANNVLVAADRPSLTDGDKDPEGTIVLAIDKVYRDEADGEQHVLQILSVEEARCLADMLIRAADSLDPDHHCMPEMIDDPWWTVTPWALETAVVKEVPPSA